MKRSYILCGIALSAILLYGCGGSGGSGSSSRAGALSLTVKWPMTDSRLIPAASNSIKATVQGSGNAQLGSNVIPKPSGGATSTTVTFNNLPAGAVTLSATAFPVADGTGIAQATGNVPATIVAGQTTSVTVTMASTIDHLSVTPATPNVARNADLPLTATAYDIDNNVVLMAASKLVWHSATPALVTVNGSGVAHGVADTTVGVQISATDSESGKTASTSVTVGNQSGGCSEGDVTGSSGPSGIFPQFGGNTGNWGVANGNGGVSGSIGWTIPTGAGGGSVPVVGAPGRVYVCSSTDDKLTAINSNNGTVLWSFTAGAGIGGTPVISNTGRIFFASFNTTYALDLNGNLLWSQPFGGESLTVAKDGGLVGRNTVSTFALDPNTGNFLWEKSSANNNISSVTPPLDSHGHVVTGVFDKQAKINLALLDGKCGTEIWRTPIAMTAATVGPDDTIYATADYGGTSPITRLVAVNGADGSVKWSTNVPVWVTPPALDTVHNWLFVLGPKGTLTKLNATNGAILWTFNIPNALPNTATTQGCPTINSAGDVAFVGSYRIARGVQKATVFYLHGSDGTILQAVDLPAGAVADSATPVYDGIGQCIVKDNNTGKVYVLP